MERFLDFLRKKLPIGYVGLDNDAEPLKDLIKKYGPNLPMGFAGFLKKDEDDLGDPKNWTDVKEEVKPSTPKTVRIPEYHYPHIEFHDTESYRPKDHEPDYSPSEWQKVTDSLANHDDYTPAMRQRISNYTSGSNYLNQYLIKKHALGENLSDNAYHHEATHDALMNAAARNKTQFPLTLYSGVSLTHPGRHPAMHLPAFTSMSHDPGVASSFAKPEGYSPDLTHVTSWYKPGSKYGGGAIMSHADTAEFYRLHFGHSDVAAKALAKKYGMPEDHYHQNPTPVLHLLRIHVPAGSHVIVPHKLSSFPTEKEVIAPAGSTIRVNREKPPRLFGSGTLVHNVTLETPKL